MSLVTLLKGVLWGTTDERPLTVNELNYLLVSQGHAEHTELVRRGNVWSAMNTAALAALVVRPSTVANFTLFNNNPSGSRVCFVILRAFAFSLVTTAAQGRSGLWLCTHKPGLVTPTNDITARGSHVGKTNYGGLSICDTAMTVIDDGWFPHGTQIDVEPTGVLPGGNLEAFPKIVVPPQCGVSTQVVSSVVGNTFTSGFEWAEEELTVR